LFEALQLLFDGVLVAEVGGWPGALVCKKTKARFGKLPDGYLGYTVGPDQRHKDANILSVYELLMKCPRISNMVLDTSDNAVCPTWPAMQEWLIGKRHLRFMDITAEAKHAIHLGRACPYQKAVVKILAAECKEYFEGLQLAGGMLRLVGSCSRVFPRDFAEGVMDLAGICFNPITELTETRTLRQVLDGGTDYLEMSMWFIGPPGYGKTTIIGSLAQEVAYRQGFDTFCEATALDPFGRLTQMGITEKVGAFAISDFDLVSGSGVGSDCALTLSDTKALLDCTANASFKARYHCATFPKHRSRLFAINPTLKDGQVNWGGWFSDQNYPVIEAFVNGDPLDSFGDRHKALLRRMVVFKVTSPLYNVVLAQADPALELLRLRAEERSYQL
jgi:hypothetical protein